MHDVIGLAIIDTSVNCLTPTYLSGALRASGLVGLLRHIRLNSQHILCRPCVSVTYKINKSYRTGKRDGNRKFASHLQTY